MCGVYPCYDHDPNGGKQHVIRHLEREGLGCPNFTNPTYSTEPEIRINRWEWECTGSSITLYRYVGKGHALYISKEIMLEILKESEESISKPL